MDLALAYAVQQRLTAEGRKLDAWQFNALTFACRQAKENLFRDATLARLRWLSPDAGLR